MNKRTLSVCGAAMFLSMLVSSAWGYEKEIEELSAKMAQKIADKGKKTVAVVDFTDLEGNVTQLDQFIAEEFSVALAGSSKGFRVIDRTRLKSIIKENKLAATGLIDPATLRKLGNITGVDAVITGTVIPFDKIIRVSLKLLDPKDAIVIDAPTVSVEIEKAITISELLGNDLHLQSISVDFPEKIESKSSALVRVSIDAKKEIEEYKKYVREKLKDLDEKVIVTNKLSASLSGLDFDVSRTTPEVQFSLKDDVIEWKWEVKPKLSGVHELHLTISIILNVGKEVLPQIIYTSDKKIIAKEDTLQNILTFIKDNYQWLWATILVPVVGLFLRKRNPRRSNIKS
ncbi:FlgO family outer membrane protein [Candidatus Electronema sp. JM]|uniref:FlgO family outer membrane protein n=1 Tax=Candidatus Electronema sp. JM TaxID=3401571 RepID=UPI003AA9DB6B